MSTRTVTTQAELDAALAAAGMDRVVINSPRGVWLRVTNNGTHSATVEAWDSATVRASDSATVRASGSATVEATPWVAIHLHSAAVKVTGGHIIDVAALDLADPETWCAYHGVPVVDGIATVHKAVDDSWSTDRGWDYSPGATPKAPDWRADNSCGHGLHFSPRPVQSREYYRQATRYVACGVALADLRPILDGGAPKCKAPRVVTPCVEVTIDGKAVQA